MRVFSGTQARELRKAAELRVEPVAIQLDRSVYTVLAYEKDRIMPSAAVLAELADLYGCTTDEFFSVVPDGE